MSNALITGANRGLGLELARQLSARGERVLAACRATSPELSDLDVHVIEGCDVGTDAGVAHLAQGVGDQGLDLLVNNAGVLERDSDGELDLDSLRRQFEVNAIGPLRVTRALARNLHPGSKVALLTSLMGSLADNGSGGYYGYRMSKAALNVVGRNLAHELAPREVPVVLLHPGMVATEMTGGRGISVEESVRGLLARIDALSPKTTGTFWHQDGRELPW